MDGIEPSVKKGSKKSKISRKQPEMSVAEISGHGRPSKRGMGLSMDMGIGSPYMLPPGLHGSHESIHSMARTHDEHDPYRPVTLMRPSMDTDSLRSGRMGPSRFADDKGSLYSMSTGHHSAFPLRDQDKAGLIANARPMSQSFGRRADSTSPRETPTSDEVSAPVQFPPRQMHSSIQRTAPPPIRKPSLDKNLPEIVEKEIIPSPPPPPPPITISEPTVPEPVVISKDLPSPPPRSSDTTATGSIPSMLTNSLTSRPESSNYGDDEAAVPAPLAPHPGITVNEPDSYDIDPVMIYSSYEDEYPAKHPDRVTSLAPEAANGQRMSMINGSRLSIMGMRPLPPDLPDDNPEVRANRIRSFYKEYFDESKPNPNGQYVEDYDDFYADGIIYDPETGGFYAQAAPKPWAQPVARRAMTPPPRARPRGSGNSSNPMHSRAPSFAYSTMSGGRPRGRPMPKKHLPPPKPLTSLPTPHRLKEDDLVFSPIDFAPPSSFRELQNGRRPDSPMGVNRPYSPSVRAFTPLASSFDALDVLPSPHSLRRSGTFTALDFAPPSKLRDPAMSSGDSGSIRSNRSGISAMQYHAVREGAYRVSRIPKEMVTTKNDFANQLKPKLDMVTPA